MRNLFKNCCYFFFMLGCLTACNSSNSTSATAVASTNAAKSVKNIGFEATYKAGGTAFYAIDAQTGQLSYMLDVGEDAGNWRRYGNPYRKSSSGPLFFRAIERGPEVGTSFYILDGQTGQIGYMLDYGPAAGTWAEFGKPLKNATITDFEAKLIGGNIVFYAYDGQAKKMYFMQDFGEQIGNWQQYGVDNN